MVERINIMSRRDAAIAEYEATHITLEDLCKRCGDWTEPEDDPTLCECGSRAANECTGATGHCYMMPEAPDEKFPDAQERWRRGY